jgi:MFS family permease
MATSSPVLDIPDFRQLFVTRVLASTALQIQAVIVGWQVWQLRHDTLLLGLLGLVEAVPAIASSFVAGHVVDRNRPAVVYRRTLTALALNAALLAFAVAPWAPIPKAARLGLVYAGVFVSGAARSFSAPSVFSLVPRIVPRAQLATAAAWNSTAFQFAAIGGPALGGLAYALVGPGAFVLPPLLFGVSVVAATRLSPEAQALRSDAVHEPFLDSLRGALGFAFGHRVLLGAMSLDMFSVLFGGAVAVLPVFAGRVFHVGSVGLGVLRAAPSVGSAIVATAIALRPMRAISGKALLIVVAGFGLSTIGFALSTHVVVAWLCLAAAGAFDGVSMVIRSTLLQLLTPERMRGRIAALSSVFITSSNEIGAFESGVAARALGLVPSVVLGGVLTLLVVTLTAVLAPELARTALRGDEPPPG